MLQVGLADFQLVHPTEMESYVAEVPTSSVDDRGKQIVNKETRHRRKRAPIDGAQVRIKGIRVLDKKEPQELTFDVDKSGRAICSTTQDRLPQVPMDCDFEFFGPKGLIEHGKVRCGGNEGIVQREVVLQGA